jgi:hypothetical protein
MAAVLMLVVPVALRWRARYLRVSPA